MYMFLTIRHRKKGNSISYLVVNPIEASQLSQPSLDLKNTNKDTDMETIMCAMYGE